MSERDRSTAERVIEAAVFAPIGLGAQLVDDVPAAVGKVRQQIVLARFIGKMAVDQGLRELEARWSSPTPNEPTSGRAEATVTETSFGQSSDATRLQPPADDSLPAPTSDQLALPDYDQLPASHIVGKLDGLSEEELAAIEAYEQAHRHRRTILGQIARLRAA